jgi:hypothetical protein
MSAKLPGFFQCAECSAILREVQESYRIDRALLLSSDCDLAELRNEYLAADEFQMRELLESQYPRTIAARRRQKEHEILTGHIGIGWWRGAGPTRHR